jgi:hypothetical protein
VHALRYSQANIRDLEIATKMRITHIKGHFLDVRVSFDVLTNSIVH